MPRLRILSAILVLALSSMPAIGAELCTSAAENAAVTAAYATAPAPLPFMAAGTLGLSEAKVLSALPADRAVGTTAAGFAAVWSSLQNWDDATVVILKGGNVIEIRGRIPPGAPSTKSQFFNLSQEGAGLGGHLRPDLVGAIYAIELAGAEGPVRGVSFTDATGENLLGVYLPEGKAAQPKLADQYGKTRALIAGLPRACP